MKKPLIFLTTLFCLGIINACSTSMHRSAEKVTLGMDKSEVLEMLGSPRRSDRYRGNDEWTYIYYQDDRPLITEIHFRQGHVVKVAKLNQDLMYLQRVENTESFEDYEEAVLSK